MEELRKLYAGVGIDGRSPIITYCRIGERSSHTWFALKKLLGYEVRNYASSWNEYANTVAVLGTALALSLVLALGIGMLRLRFCFYCVSRDFIERRDARGLLGIVGTLLSGSMAAAASGWVFPL